MDVPETAAGQKVKCPACGDVRVIPQPGAAGDAQGAGVANPSPRAGPERTVMIVRPAMFRARPLLFLVVLAGFVAGAAGAVYFGLVAHRVDLAWAGVSLGVLSMIGLGFWKLRSLETSLEITNKRTIERKGVFSRFLTEVRHEDVRNIQVTQTFAQRLLGIGRIAVSSAAQNEIEIVADDMPRPDRVREVIDGYRNL